MNKKLLNTGIQKYIRNFKGSDTLSVLLKSPLFEGVDNKELVQQLEGRLKSKKKLPLWYRTEGIYYPPKQALEQSSSEETASYKSSLLSGDSLLDITGGLGIDSYYFSRVIKTVIYCEKQAELAAIAGSNFDTLAADNIRIINGDGIKYIQGSEDSFSWVYLDPSRRRERGQRVFLLGDYDPPLPDSLHQIWQHTSNIILKTSPLIDISMGIDSLKNVVHIHVVAVQNEVKELVWLLQKNSITEPKITAVNINKEGSHSFSFYRSEEMAAQSTYGPSEAYIYEPYAALLKAGAFKILGVRYGLKKIHEHSHLYTSEAPVEFPGRKFRLLEALDYSSKNMKRYKGKKANVSSRNFPESVASIRKKYKLKDGGEQTLYFTRNHDGQLKILVCDRIA